MCYKINTDMTVIDAILSRRSVRLYTDKIVSVDVFNWLIENSMNSPTACNEMGWKVIYIDKQEIIKDLYLRGSASFLKKAKQCFLLCYSNRTDNKEWFDHIQSGAAFINTFQLLAYSIGIGSCWIGHLPNKSEIRKIFNIDKDYEPISLVSFGYFKGNKVKKNKKLPQLDDVISYNSFRSDSRIYSNRSNLKRRLQRKIYYFLPAFFRKKIKLKASEKYEKKFN